MNPKNYIIGGGAAVVVIVAGIIAFYIQHFDWALHIVIFDVGQADAIALVSKNGDACVIDAGEGSTAGKKLVKFLKNTESNGVAEINSVKLGFATHYDADHIGGFKILADSGIKFLSFYDQGPSKKREGKSTYIKYLTVTGDINDNMIADPGENFVRKKPTVGRTWKLGDSIKIKCVSICGDTKGSQFDIDLDPSDQEIDENPGSIALYITLGDFEFYTAGDQTSDDWIPDNADTEINIINSGVLGTETDIDVLKVSHHGSETSTGEDFVLALDPEVAIISSKYTSGDELPKMISIMQLLENMAVVYITGDGRNPNTGLFTDANTSVDDGYRPDPDNIFNNAGDVHIYVSEDGKTYRVYSNDEYKSFSSVDADNVR